MKTKKGLIVLVVISFITIIFYFTFAKSITRWLYADNIPALPNLNGQPKVFVNYILEKHEAALNLPTSDKHIGELGIAYHSNFFYEQAELCYNYAKRLNPDEWKWSYYHALIKEELGDAQGTIANLLEVVKINSKLSQAWFKLGNSYLKLNSFQEANNNFIRVLELDDYVYKNISIETFPNKGAFPLKAYAHLNLARIALLQNKIEIAKSKLDILIKKEPSFGSAYRLMGQLYHVLGNEKLSDEYILRAGDFASYTPPADLLYDQLILQSRNSNFISKQIDIAIKSQNYNWVKILSRHIYKISPNNGEVIAKLLKLLLHSNIFTNDSPLLKKYIGIYNSDDDKLVDMAKYIIFRGYYKSALKVLDKAIDYNPQNIEAKIEYAKALTKDKQFAYGIEYCKNAISAHQNNAEIRNELSKIFIHQGKFDKAIKELKIAQRLEPNNATSLKLLGIIYKRKGFINKALSYLKKGIKANPRDVDIQLELGIYLLDLRQWQEAIIHFENALKASPHNIDLIERYAWIYATCPDSKIRNGEEALKLATRLIPVLKNTPVQDIKCSITLSVAYAELKNFDTAIEIVNTSIKRAKNFRLDEFIPEFESLIELFQAKKPYHL
jgi:tetratricopeptide (TPR) repeat protein